MIVARVQPALELLHNPRYAGAFVFGRTRTRVVDGHVRVTELPREQWTALFPGAHEGYITWDEYEENQQRLRENAQAYGGDRPACPPREGPALLQGLAICGRCGERLSIHYHQRRGRLVPDYICQHETIQQGRSADAATFAGVPGAYTRIAVGEPVAGWLAYQEVAADPPTFAPDGITRADDPLLLYFTSGTTAQPKLVLHTHTSYPIGHLSTLYWLGLQPGDVHLNIASPGWAKHAWSNLFASWTAEATVFVYNYTRFQAPALLDQIVRCGVTTLCAPPTVWRLLIQEDLGAWRVALREVVGAGEPLKPEVIAQVQQAWGLTIRDGYGQTESRADT